MKLKKTTALVMLDARLGCLKKHLEPDSDPQRLITASNIAFESIYHLDLKVPFWKIVSTPWYRKFVKHSNIFLDIALKNVKQAQERSRDDVEEDELSVLQRILKRDPNTVSAVVMAIEMLFAGIDTTSSTAGFTLYYLACNPEKQELLYEEIRNVMSPKDEILSAEKLENMKYLRACIKESMRLSPVSSGISRILDEDIVLSNYKVPRDTEIVILHSIMSRIDENFSQADQYIPERWLRGQAVTGCPAEHKTHPFVYLPFGHGPRQCIGTRFANIALETLLARVIRDYRLEWHYGEMKYYSHVINMPGIPLSIRMINRK